MELILAIAALCQINIGSGRIGVTTGQVKEEQRLCQGYYSNCILKKSYYGNDVTDTGTLLKCMNNKK